MVELWKPIPGFEHYEVSDAGQIRSLTASKMRAAGHILKRRMVGAGYCGVSLYRNGERHDFYVHRLVALAFIGKPEPDFAVNHKDGNKLNNALSNLEYCTAKQNTAHAWTARLLPPPPVMRGEKNPRAKINDAIVVRALRCKLSGMSNGKISEVLSIPLHTVENIVYRRGWLHVPMPQIES